MSVLGQRVLETLDGAVGLLWAQLHRLGNARVDVAACGEPQCSSDPVNAFCIMIPLNADLWVSFLGGSILFIIPKE